MQGLVDLKSRPFQKQSRRREGHHLVNLVHPDLDNEHRGGQAPALRAQRGFRKEILCLLIILLHTGISVHPALPRIASIAI